ncbi:hypothetical protein [Flavobacterium reichenbachii]|uniref:Uncharacterized protein n=1 Tax=Flavobacterium reichenbachii TaxID=362418 RepID=A0A085ZN48_9FLAO|nr:hypothetical protein [Flavobacterium reichenbachii]KFF05862.1 hypothetical protein IW19_10155 [Flavobacterium reichenbachii]OXB12745.1 hypothetical protein B0A68_18335 [Flavobacterium reichenbachii]
MNWIRKTVIFLSLIIIAFFASQAEKATVQIIEKQNTDTNFSKDIADSQAFVQPQANYQFAANIKTEQIIPTKWFESLLAVLPPHQAVNTVTNFANQFTTQSKKVLLMLYAFHFFW